MSTASHQSRHTHHRHAHQQESQTDPTRTKTQRRRYAQKLRGRYADINTKIRTGVRDRDIFGLDEPDRGALSTRQKMLGWFNDLPLIRRRRQDKQIETFDAWLERQQRQDVLTVIDRNDNQWVRHGYGRGLDHAQARLREQGIDVPEEDIRRAFNQPIHRDTLQLLYTSDYSDLGGITAEVSKQANRVLTDGFAQGHGPAKIARGLTDVVDDVGKTRATVLARTSVVEAHAYATLNRFERFGVEEVGVKAEWSTAGDDRVCQICQALEGRVFTIEEARGMLPAHALCRCAWLPHVPQSASNVAGLRAPTPAVGRGPAAASRGPPTT